MQWILVAMMGLALSAACGFRVFVPLLVTSVAVKAGFVTVGPGFAWMGSDAALATFALATVLEIGAYYIPWLDHLLDTAAMPSAVVAGTLISASFITGMDPLMKWTLAAIVGGGAAGAVQATTSVVRVASTVATGGLGNWIVATAEAFLATAVSMLAIFLPIIAVVSAAVLAGFALAWLVRRQGWVRVRTAGIQGAG